MKKNTNSFILSRTFCSGIAVFKVDIGIRCHCSRLSDNPESEVPELVEDYSSFVLLL